MVAFVNFLINDTERERGKRDTQYNLRSRMHDRDRQDYQLEWLWLYYSYIVLIIATVFYLLYNCILASTHSCHELRMSTFNKEQWWWWWWWWRDISRTVLWVCSLSSWLETKSLTAQRFLQYGHCALCRCLAACQLCLCPATFSSAY